LHRGHVARVSATARVYIADQNRHNDDAISGGAT
jgi:hypothetical protein